MDNMYRLLKFSLEWFMRIACCAAILGLLLTRSAAAQSEPSFDDYLKPYFNLDLNEVGFRIGIPILAWEIAKVPAQRVKWTDYNEVEVHNFRLDSIGATGLNIAFSLRWRQYENNLTGGRYKRAETNCDAIAQLKLEVSADYRITYRNPPTISGVDCSTSGFGLEQLLDYMTQGLTWIMPGGGQIGLFDLLAGFGAIGYDFYGYLEHGDVAISGPIKTRILDKQLLKWAEKIYDLDESDNQVHLSQIKYDAKGMWLIFTYPQALEEGVRQIMDKAVSLTATIQPGGSVALACVDNISTERCGATGAQANFTKVKWGIIGVNAGGTVVIQKGYYPENIRVTKRVTMTAFGGAVSIGNRSTSTSTAVSNDSSTELPPSVYLPQIGAP